MSPEVCQNKPYSYQSDIWALGCILYELCALKHAFHSENLLGLVYKIVQEEPDPLPEAFSGDMQELVNLLL
jgi:NIMA (never in mitosis gene a)-related kinase 1/4/5